MLHNSQFSGTKFIYHSILSPDGLSEIVQAEYGLPRPVECSLFNSGLNEIYLVVSKRDSYILRVTRVERNGPVQEDACRFELDLLNSIHAKGVPVARPLRRENGDNLGVIDAPEGKRYYALYGFVEGEPISSPDRAQAYLLGELLAKLHLTTNEFSCAHSRPHLDEKYLIDEPMRRLRQFPGIPLADFDVLEQLSQSLREMIRRIPTQPSEFGIIHGDFWWKNVLFANGTAVLIDFDFCGHGYRAYDVASLNGTAKMFGQQLQPGVMDSFISGYQSIRQLSQAEIAALPAFEKIRMIWACGLWTGSVNVHGTRWFFENLHQAFSNLQK